MDQLKSECDYVEWITPRLGRLSARHRAAFAAAAAERLFGTYRFLARKDSRLQPEVLRLALDRVWAYAAGEGVTDAALEDARQRVEPLIPDLNGPKPPEDAPLVLDATAAVAYAVESCLSGDPDNARAAGICARDSVHQWVDSLLRPGLTILKHGEIRAVQRSIDEHPLMVRELEHVQRVVEFLIGRAEIDRAACSQLRAMWPNGSKSNIDLQ